MGNDEGQDERSRIESGGKAHTKSRIEGSSGTMAVDYKDDESRADPDHKPPALSGSLQGHIGRQLRAVYSELVQEPIPDKFSELLQQLSNSQKKSDKKSQE